MDSFRMVLIPHCGGCGTDVPAAAVGQLPVTSRLLDPSVHRRLEADGWHIKPGSRGINKGIIDPIGGDSLTCPACVAVHQAAAETATARLTADLSRPRVKILGMADRLGDGWTLTQRDGDVGCHRWLVEREGTVRGQVRRYKRRTSQTYSPGWEAFTLGGTHWFRRDAIHSCQHTPGSSFLWSGRDVAAWGVAFAPGHDSPRPEWSRRAPRIPKASG
ncbi:hypothetical protein [Streptomyces sp. NPDC091278]|uniref:hypothetical protein n=1 Tax=Streptomyces sp. NPDC091278 TaxID=3155301 RepID=UPI003450E653